MSRKILILGAGELGAAIITSLLDHPSFDSSQTSLFVAIRPETLASLDLDTTSSKVESLRTFRSRGISFTSIDMVSDNEATLSSVFAKYNSVVHAGAMTLPEGTQLKVTRAALAAQVDEYVPWQWGVDYDVIGRDGGLGLFSEQCDVRDLLRAQTHTQWFIVSCGVFMSFLFENFWGVVVRDDEGKINCVRALGGWDHLITATTVEDIARCHAEILLVDRELRGKPVYISGDSMTYDEFVKTVERVVGRDVTREVWTTELLKERSVQEPENKLLKYRVVFSEDKGLGWEKKGAYNDKKCIGMETIEQYMPRIGMQ